MVWDSQTKKLMRLILPISNLSTSIFSIKVFVINAMRKTILLYLLIFGLSINGQAQKKTIQKRIENTENKKGSNSVAINLNTKSQIKSDCDYDAFIKLPRITNIDRKSLQIDKISLFGTSFSSIKNNELAKGKILYKSVMGRLETFFWIVPDHATYEILVSYNGKGEQVDAIRIGSIGNYSGDRGFASLNGNKIVYGSSCGDCEDDVEVSYTSYELNKDFKFKEIK